MRRFGHRYSEHFKMKFTFTFTKNTLRFDIWTETCRFTFEQIFILDALIVIVDERCCCFIDHSFSDLSVLLFLEAEEIGVGRAWRCRRLSKRCRCERGLWQTELIWLRRFSYRRSIHIQISYYWILLSHQAGTKSLNFNACYTLFGKFRFDWGNVATKILLSDALNLSSSLRAYLVHLLKFGGSASILKNDASISQSCHVCVKVNQSIGNWSKGVQWCLFGLIVFSLSLCLPWSLLVSHPASW